MKKPIKLVLSGSGTKYPVFVGAIKRLEEANFDIIEVCGTSGGSIVAAGIAGGMNAHQLQALVLNTLPGPLLDWNWWPTLDARKGRFAGNKILAALRKNLPNTWDECKIPLHIVTFNIQRGQHVIWNNNAKNSDVPLLIRASMSLPIIFDPVMIHGEMHIDGGIGANFPLDVFGDGKNVIGMRFKGSDGSKAKKIATKFEMGAAVIEGFIESSTKEHVEDAQWAQVMLLDSKNSGLSLEMSAKDVHDMIDEGYRCADRWLRESA